MHTTSHDGSGVNGGTFAAGVHLGGIPLDEAGRVPMVAFSLLSEGEHLCKLCGENIEGFAAYVTVPDGRWRDGFREVALLCAEHVEFDETTDGPKHVREVLADVRSRRVKRRLRRVPGAVLTAGEVLARFAGGAQRGMAR